MGRKRKYNTPEAAQAAHAAQNAARYLLKRREIIAAAAKWQRDNPDRNRASKRKQKREQRGIVNATDATKHDACEMCGAVTDLCFDHDPKTGEFRGWLCRTCNLALGWLERILNADLLDKFLQYLSC